MDIPGVVSATVNVLCELVRHNPGEYLTLAPQLFQLLTTSSNNWMLIKIIKLVSSVQDPSYISDLIHCQVWFSITIRTSPCQKVASTHNGPHFDNSSHFIVV